MKHGKKPTAAQRKRLVGLKLDPSHWLIERDTTTDLVLVHRYSDVKKTIWKVTK